MPKKPDPAVAVLQRKVLELEAQLAHVPYFAKIGIEKADRKRTLGSSVIVQMHYLGGAPVCLPFALKDGLSDATIAALIGDLSYTYAKATDFKLEMPDA